MRQRHRVQIYLVKDAEDTPRYVGKSRDPEKRFRSHRHHYKWAVNISILEDVPPWKSWQEREKFWIAFFRKNHKLENIAEGGNGSDAVSQSTKDKISNSLKNIPEEIQAQRTAHRVALNTGKKRTEETKQKLRQGRLGKKHTQESKDLISKASRGRPAWNKGKPPSERNKLQLRIANLGKKCPNIIFLALKNLPKPPHKSKGRKQNPEVVARRAASWRGGHHSAESLLHYKIAANRPERRLKLSLALKGKKKGKRSPQALANWYQSRWGSKNPQE